MSSRLFGPNFQRQIPETETPLFLAAPSFTFFAWNFVCHRNQSEKNPAINISYSLVNGCNSYIRKKVKKTPALAG